MSVHEHNNPDSFRPRTHPLTGGETDATQLNTPPEQIHRLTNREKRKTHPLKLACFPKLLLDGFYN